MESGILKRCPATIGYNTLAINEAGIVAGQEEGYGGYFFAGAAAGIAAGAGHDYVDAGGVEVFHKLAHAYFGVNSAGTDGVAADVVAGIHEAGVFGEAYNGVFGHCVGCAGSCAAYSAD